MTSPTYSRIPQELDEGDIAESAGLPKDLGHAQAQSLSPSQRAGHTSPGSLMRSQAPPSPIYYLPAIEDEYERNPRPQSRNSPIPGQLQPQAGQQRSTDLRQAGYQDGRLIQHNYEEFEQDGNTPTGEDFESLMKNMRYALKVCPIIQKSLDVFRIKWVSVACFMCAYVFTCVLYVMVIVSIIMLSYPSMSEMLDDLEMEDEDRGTQFMPNEILNYETVDMIKNAEKNIEDLYDEDFDDLNAASTLALLSIYTLVYILSPIMLSGLYAVYLAHAKGHSIALSDFLRGARISVPIILLEMIYAYTNSTSFLLGWYSRMSFGYAPLLFLEHPEIRFLRVLPLSFKMVHRDISGNVVLSLVAMALMTIGSPLMFITFPISYFMYAEAYTDIFKI